MISNRVLPLLTDSIFIVLSFYFVFVYTRSLLLTPQLHMFSFFIYQTFFLIFQLMTLVLLLARSGLVAFSSKAADYVYTVFAFGSPMFLRPVVPIGTSIVGICSEFMGTVLVIGAFLSLNSSFGIGPENRGIKSSGAYRVVRHPMYLGYLLTETGFVLSNLSVFNVLILVVALLFLVLRLQAEERLLSDDPVYQAYLLRTRWRLVPFVY